MSLITPPLSRSRSLPILSAEGAENFSPIAFHGQILIASQAEKLSQSQTALLKRAQGAQELRAQTASGDYVIAFSTAPQVRIQTEPFSGTSIRS
jgi:hypothetical protein